MSPTLLDPTMPRGALRPAVPNTLPALQAPRLLDQVRERVRYLHYSRRTEQAYVYWCKAFIRFHQLRHPRDMGAAEVETFLTWLADERQLASSTHKQALSALVFLYTKVLQVGLAWVDQLERPRVRRRLPVVLSRDEVTSIFLGMQGEHALLARLLYGTGLRISEALQLRVKDVDFSHQALIVREGKGGKDRVLMLPQSLAQPLRDQLGQARLLWAEDAAQQRGGVELPYALERKYPRASTSWAWFWVFPQATHSTDPRSGVVRRHHLYDQTFQRAFKRAVQAAGIAKPATPHTLRHYSESRNMPRQPCRRSRTADGKTGRTLGIFSPATFCGVTGDDRDSDIRGSAASSGRGCVPGVGSPAFRADAISWLRACLVERRNTIGARLRELA